MLGIQFEFEFSMFPRMDSHVSNCRCAYVPKFELVYDKFSTKTESAEISDCLHLLSLVVNNEHDLVTTQRMPLEVLRANLAKDESYNLL